MSDNPRVQLLPRLIETFRMKPIDTQDLAESLYQTSSQAWLDALSEMSTQYGCGRKAPNQPSGKDAVYLRQMVEEDAQQITNTWNADIEKELRKQFAENPRSNRYQYLERIEAWSLKRYEWKSRQISIQVVQNTRRYAQARFREENGIKPQAFVYVGPPPVSDACKRRTAAGIVTPEYAKANPTPAHPGNCVHEWEEVITKTRLKNINCATLWVG